jgi:preprotein translocase subunit SecE
VRLKSYFKEAFNELFHKVSWPSWAELQDSTIVVMIASAIIALLVFVMDFSFQWVMQAIYGMF